MKLIVLENKLNFMENFVITDYQYKQRIEKLASIFNVSPQEDCDDHFIKFDNTFGKGSIRGINFDHGLGVMMFDLELNRDIVFEYDLGRRHPIRFIYCSEGSIELKALGSEIHHEVIENEAMIFAPRGDENYTIKFKKGIRIKCMMVNVVRFLYLRKIECDIDTIPTSLREMFKDTVGVKSFYFKSTSEPIITNILIQLFKSEQSGLERKLLVEANAIKLITTLIRRYRVESSVNGSTYRFSKEDIRLINLAKNHIIDNIEDTPTVRELSKMIVINTNKLQKGFNMLFGKSIRQFTISLKMHYALNLLDDRNMSVSEIAHKVGYTNKGHFSYLFKKEFGLLPSEYSKKSTI